MSKLSIETNKGGKVNKDYFGKATISELLIEKSFYCFYSFLDSPIVEEDLLKRKKSGEIENFFFVQSSGGRIFFEILTTALEHSIIKELLWCLDSSNSPSLSN